MGSSASSGDAVAAAAASAASCSCWRATRSTFLSARVYSGTQRWLYGWRAALACESSSRIVVAAEWPVHVCGEAEGEAGGWGVRAAHGLSRSLIV